MPRFRLRYQATDLEMPQGDFVIGRSSTCNLALDDALVSRRHAVLHVTADEVALEDLGSRNGVHVNGDRVQGSRRVDHLDRIVIGAQEMVLIRVGDEGRQRRATRALKCDVCQAPLSPQAVHCPQCGAPRAGRATLAGATLEMRVPSLHSSRPPGPAQQTDEPTRQADAFQLIALIADKALTMKRYDEAERMLDRHLASLLAKVKRGDNPPEEEVDTAVRYALRLAEAPGRGRWIDWVFELYTALGQLLPGNTIDRLHQIVRKTRYADARAVRDYLLVLRNRRLLSAGDKFLLRRIEGLERVVSA